MSIAYTERAETRNPIAAAPAWLFVGAGIYLLLLIHGDGLLRDADTFWADQGRTMDRGAPRGAFHRHLFFHARG